MSGWATKRTIDGIRRIIASGRANSGGLLPSERMLADMLQVSRFTVRAALQELRCSGEVETRAGRDGGTFVSRQNPAWHLYAHMDIALGSHDVVDHPAGVAQGVGDSLRRQGVAYRSVVLSAKKAMVPDRAAEALGLPHGAEAYELRRLRASEGGPVALECAYLPCDRYPGILEKDLSRSLYSLMRDEYGVAIGHISEALEVVPACGAEASSLEVKVGAPLMSSVSTAFDVRGEPVEHSRDVYRADRVRFVVENEFEPAGASCRAFGAAAQEE